MADFYKALPYILDNEGGKSEHPNDPGGRTNLGITQQTLKMFNLAHPEEGMPEDVFDLTTFQAAVIYNKNYWRFDGIDSQRVATKVLDMCVNFGMGTAILMLQSLLDVPIDGKFGPLTCKAVNESNEEELLPKLVSVCKRRYQAIVDRDNKMAVFQKGWMRRAERLP